MSSTKEKLMAAFGYLIPIFFPVPVLTIIAIQVYYIIFRGESLFLDHHSRENVNFQISFQLYTFILLLLGFILFNLPESLLEQMILFNVLFGFATFGVIIFSIAFWLVTMIIAIIAALSGKRFRFPLTIRFIK